jgi:hypothetical protein
MHLRWKHLSWCYGIGCTLSSSSNQGLVSSLSHHGIDEFVWFWIISIHSDIDLLALINTKPTCVLRMCLLIVPLFKNRSGYRTPVKGLYMCGAGSHPGGGVMGAPGRNAATIVLKDRSRAWHACSLVCKVCCPITEGVLFRRALGNKFQK